MLKERRTAVETVAAAFLPVERSAQATAVASARCIATMIEARETARLPTATGADELVLMAEGTLLAVQAHARFMKLHAQLRALPASIGVHAYGTEGDCPPNEPFVGATHPAPLRVVG